MVVKVIIEMVRMKLGGSEEGIGSLIKDLQEPSESVELRLDVLSHPKDVKAKSMEAIEKFRTYILEGQLEGWELDSCGDCWVNDGCLVDSDNSPTPIDAYMYRAKVSDKEHGEHGWVHMRESYHNPNIALNIQSILPGACQSMAQLYRDKFLLASGVDKIIDISQLNNYIKSE